MGSFPQWMRVSPLRRVDGHKETFELELDGGSATREFFGPFLWRMHLGLAIVRLVCFIIGMRVEATVTPREIPTPPMPPGMPAPPPETTKEEG